jgi:hypothetical protein
MEGATAPYRITEFWRVALEADLETDAIQGGEQPRDVLGHKRSIRRDFAFHAIFDSVSGNVEHIGSRQRLASKKRDMDNAFPRDIANYGLYTLDIRLLTVICQIAMRASQVAPTGNIPLGENWKRQGVNFEGHDFTPRDVSRAQRTRDTY